MSREARRLAREKRERDQKRLEKDREEFQRRGNADWQEATHHLGVLFRYEGYRIEAKFEPKTGEVGLKTDSEILAQLTRMARWAHDHPEWKAQHWPKLAEGLRAGEEGEART